VCKIHFNLKLKLVLKVFKGVALKVFKGVALKVFKGVALKVSKGVEKYYCICKKGFYLGENCHAVLLL